MDIESDPVTFIINILSCVLGKDDKKRKLAEQQLSHISQTNPNLVIATLLKIIEHNDTTIPDFIQYRKLASTLIKKYISNTADDDKTSPAFYKKLTEDTRFFLKSKILSLLENENDFGMAKILVNIITELDSTMQDLEEEWPELVSFIEKLIKIPQNLKTADKVMLQKTEIGFMLLSETFAHSAEYYQGKLGELCKCFIFAIDSNTEMSTKVACIEAICNMFYSMDDIPEEISNELFPRILICLKQCINLNNENLISKIIDGLSMISGDEPRLFMNYFGDLLTLCAMIATRTQAYEKEKLREIALEIILEIIDRVPTNTLKGAKTTEEYFEDLLKAVLFVMRQMDSEIEESWAKPIDLPYYDYDPTNDVDNDTAIPFGKQAIDRILSSTKAEIGLTLLGSALIPYFSNTEDWRFRYVALAAVSQVGPYIRNPSALSTLVPLILNHITVILSPKLKHAALCCLTQISKDSDPVFHTTYHDKIMPVLAMALDFQLPKIQQQACFALKSFVSKLGKTNMEMYAHTLMEKLSKMVMQDAIIQLQESSISVIGQIANSAPEIFKDRYYDQVMTFILELLSKLKGTKLSSLVSNIIECITLISKASGREKASSYLKTVIDLFLNIQKQQETMPDEGFIRSALLSGWQSLCQLCKEDLLGYAELIIPELLKLAESVPGIAVGKTKPSSKELAKTLLEAGIMPPTASEENIKQIVKSQPEEVDREEAIALISTMVDTFGTKLGKYLDNCAHIFMNILEYSSQESLKRTCAIYLKTILFTAKKAVSTPDHSFLLPTIKQYLQVLLKAAINEIFPENIETELRVAKEILHFGDAKCFDQKELMQFLEHAMTLMSSSNRRKIANNSVKESQTLDEEDLNILGEDNEKEDLVQLEIANLIVAVFKTHREEAIIFVPVVYPDLINEMIKPVATTFQKIFALTLIVGIIENLQFVRIPMAFPALCDHILSHSNEAEPKIRRISLYGIGVMTYSSGEYFPKIAENTYWVLKQALESPIPEKVNRKEWKISQENAASALGKLIFYQGKLYAEHLPSLVGYWLKKLPLRLDSKEAKIQCDIFSELLESDCIVTAGNQGENIVEIMRIITEILDTDKLSPESALKISKGLNKMITVPDFYKKMTQIVDGYPADKKSKLVANIGLSQKHI